jgi:thiamine pyrophosphokinase
MCRLWDAKTAKCSGVINTTGNNLFVAWTSDGNTVAVSNKENTISFIDVRKCKVLKSHKLNYEVQAAVLFVVGGICTNIGSCSYCEPFW